MYLVYRFRRFESTISAWVGSRFRFQVERLTTAIVKIIKCLKSKLLSHSQGHSDIESNADSCDSHQPFETSPGMELEKMHLMWDRESDALDPDSSRDDRDVDLSGLASLGDLDDDDDDFEIPEVSKYREAMAEASAYYWLRSTLKAISLLHVPDAQGELDYRRTIREPII